MTSRRKFIQLNAALSVLATIPNSVKAFYIQTKERLFPKKQHKVNLFINNKEFSVEIDTRTTLLDLLRENLQLTGTKKGCDFGQCGACTVHIDGQRMLSCLTLAASLEKKKITTIEGLAVDENQLHPMQQAFIDCDGFQCGYCTPGQIMSAVACVKEGRTHSVEEIKEFMSGNLCRCGAYNGIVNAIQKCAHETV